MITNSNFYLSFINRLCHFNSADTGISRQNIAVSHELEGKEKQLERYMSHLGSLIIAYPGDIESAYLAFIAHKVLGDRMLALIADSHPRQELQEAIDFSKLMKITLKAHGPGELPHALGEDSISGLHSKLAPFKAMEQARAEFGFRHLAFALDRDDLEEINPEALVTLNNHVLTPLVEAKLNKEEIRVLISRLNGVGGLI